MGDELELLGLVAFGFAVGTYGTIIGLGGGFILVPALLLVSPDYEPEQVTAISLAVVCANTISGSIAYARQGRIDYVTGLLFAASSAPGVLAGVFLVKPPGADDAGRFGGRFPRRPRSGAWFHNRLRAASARAGRSGAARSPARHPPPARRPRRHRAFTGDAGGDIPLRLPAMAGDIAQHGRWPDIQPLRHRRRSRLRSGYDFTAALSGPVRGRDLTVHSRVYDWGGNRRPPGYRDAGD